MASLIPRGFPSPQDNKQNGQGVLSPSEDLNLTVKNLLDINTKLQEKVDELEGDKKHFQMKLEEYIRYDREMEPSRSHEAHSQEWADQLMAENVRLKEMLMKEREMSELYSPNSQHLERNQRAVLLSHMNELQTASRTCQKEHIHQIELLKIENSALKEEMRRWKNSPNQYADWRGYSNQERPSSWENSHPHYQKHLTLSTSSGGYSSLPEPSFSTSSTSYSGRNELPDITSLHLSNPSNVTDTNSTELRKLKKQLEKYKSTNIDLDQKLKDAKLELQKYNEQRGNSDVVYRMDVERLRSDNSQLRSQLDRALEENNHLRSMSSRQFY